LAYFIYIHIISKVCLYKEAQEFVAIKRFKENGKSLIKRELKMLNNLRSC